MNCSWKWIEGYLDEELEPDLEAAVAEHLADCRQCTAIYWQIHEQQVAVRSLAPYYAAPAELQRSVRKALRQAAAEGTESRNGPWRWIAIAASFLLAASLTWNLSRLQSRAPESEITAQYVLSSHVRSLMGTHLLDVASTDQHTVKPWFNGKLDFSPDVKDFASQGFPLIGGRIEYLADRSVAALIYQRRQHVINLFTWPSPLPGTKGSTFVRNGYNVLQWSDGSMTYWAVSDISSAEIQQFKALCLK
jgi:anti-sigma factor RsiW